MSPIHLTRIILLSSCLALAACGGGPLGGSASNAGVSLHLARAAHSSGDLVSALQLYADLDDGTAKDPPLLIERADTMLEAAHYDDAVETYSRAVPTSAALAAWLGLVRAHTALGEPDIALKAADQALAMAPKEARVLVNRGVVLDSLERHAEAQDSYRAALLLAPRSVAARNNLGLSLALSGDYKQAIALLAPLARNAAATPKIRENLALAYGLSGDAERAAMVSRVDLDEPNTSANLDFFARVRTSSR